MYYGFKKGRITVVSIAPKNRKVLVDCLCGNKNIEITITNLARAYPTCTMCKTKEKYPREYKTYDSMLQRCYNTNSPDYKNYGARGITVCSKWKKDFYYFLADMGKRPDNTSLDRVDNSGNYCKENCRWADAVTQGSNRRKKNMTFHKGAWQVYLTVSGKSIYVGRFKTEQEAQQAISKLTERGDY